MDDRLQSQLLQSEAHIYAKYILANHPDAKIAILYQNDDLGKDYVKGLKDGLGAKASSMIIAEKLPTNCLTRPSTCRW